MWHVDLIEYKQRKLPRGIRNNNPGNIRISSTRWQGQAAFQIDPAFVVFDDAVMGVRALMRLLMTYHVKYGLDTVESIINRYAPPVENATDHYIRAVAGHLGVNRRDRIDLRVRARMIGLAQAIIVHENGHPPKDLPPHWYAADIYIRAADMVLTEAK